jgi:hypothetical protein
MEDEQKQSKRQKKAAAFHARKKQKVDGEEPEVKVAKVKKVKVEKVVVEEEEEGVRRKSRYILFVGRNDASSSQR